MRNAVVITSLASVLLIFCGGCSQTPPTDTIEITYDFTNGALGWEADVSDYSLGQEEIIEFESEIRELPEEIEGGGSGYFVSSMNRSDDLFVFLKRNIGADEGLEPNQAYRLSYVLRIASNAPSGCAGVGGAPGEGPYVKVGGSTEEPVRLPADAEGYYGLSVDKGAQSQSGPAGTVIGDVANGEECDDPDNAPYVTITVEGEHEVEVSTDENGDLWLLVGTDSAFEGLTAIYYQSIVVTLSKSSSS